MPALGRAVWPRPADSRVLRSPIRLPYQRPLRHRAATAAAAKAGASRAQPAGRTSKTQLTKLTKADLSRLCESQVDITVQTTVADMESVMKVLGLPTTKGGARKTKADKLRELQMYAEANEATDPANASSISVMGRSISVGAITTATSTPAAAEPAAAIDAAQAQAALQEQAAAPAVEAPEPLFESEMLSEVEDAVEGKLAGSNSPTVAEEDLAAMKQWLDSTDEEEWWELAGPDVKAALSGSGTVEEVKQRLLDYMAINTRLGLEYARPLYLYDSSNLKDELKAATQELRLCEAGVTKDKHLQALQAYAEANAVAEDGDIPSSMGVGLCVIKQGTPLPTTPRRQSYKRFSDWKFAELTQALATTGQAESGSAMPPTLAAFSQFTAAELGMAGQALRPLYLRGDGTAGKEGPPIGLQELQKLTAEVPMPSSASLDGLEEVAREEATEVLAGAELAGPPPSEEAAQRGMGGDLELDDVGPPGVKPRSEEVSALGTTPTPADSDLPDSISNSSIGVAESPLEELPLNTNAADANPLRERPQDRVSAERDLMGGQGLDDSAMDPDDSALQEEEAAMLAELGAEDEPLDFEDEDDFGPQERGTTQQSQSISYAGDAGAMMEGEGFQDDDEDGIIAELQDVDSRAADLAASDLARQNQAFDMGGDAGTERGRGEAKAAQAAQGEQWEGEERPTVEDLDAMGWFSEENEEAFDGPASVPGWVRGEGPAPSKPARDQDLWRDTEDAQQQQSAEISASRGWYDPRNTMGSGDEEEAPGFTGTALPALQDQPEELDSPVGPSVPNDSSPAMTAAAAEVEGLDRLAEQGVSLAPEVAELASGLLKAEEDSSPPEPLVADVDAAQDDFGAAADQRGIGEQMGMRPTVPASVAPLQDLPLDGPPSGPSSLGYALTDEGTLQAATSPADSPVNVPALGQLGSPAASPVQPEELDGPLGPSDLAETAAEYSAGPAADVPPGLLQGVEEESKDVQRLRDQVADKRQQLATLQQQVHKQEDPSWAEAMRLHILVENLRGEKEKLDREMKAGNLSDLRSAAARSRVQPEVKAMIQQTLGRIEAELASLDADMVQCDAAAARLHRELAAARERLNPSGPLGSSPEPALGSGSTPAAPAGTAVLTQRRTNGAHLRSLDAVKAQDLPEGYLYEAVDLPEEPSRSTSRKVGVTPGVYAAATVMGAYKVAQDLWGRFRPRKAAKLSASAGAESTKPDPSDTRDEESA
ncbi:hypothetical protein WJX73_009653 [Symbiochloris irregularis]|uniref:SAP domain-containing protein n=1 Tax=Symbiochloris irregularis TaxID=706552 RepID=A0AAW1NMH2_9CHLO